MSEHTRRRRVNATDPTGRGTTAWLTAIRQRSIPTTPKLLLIVLTDYINGDDECWPGHTTIAPEVGVTPRTVQTILADLEFKGVIEREPRLQKGGRGRSTDLIRLRYQALAMRFPLIDQPEDVSPETDGPTGSSQQVSPETDDIPSSLLNQSVEPDARSTFDLFWSIYPRKLAKGAAKKAWLKAVRSTEADRIIEAARRYRDDPDRSDQFTAYPATWLNAERWDDDPPPKHTNGRSSTDAYEPMPHYDPETGTFRYGDWDPITQSFRDKVK